MNEFHIYFSIRLMTHRNPAVKQALKLASHELFLTIPGIIARKEAARGNPIAAIKGGLISVAILHEVISSEWMRTMESLALRMSVIQDPS